MHKLIYSSMGSHLCVWFVTLNANSLLETVAFVKSFPFYRKDQKGLSEKYNSKVKVCSEDMVKPMVTVFSFTFFMHPHRTLVLNSPCTGEPEDWQV